MNTDIIKSGIILSIFLFASSVWAIDPNINTQSTDFRSNGANGSPGFNPCLGGTRGSDGVCGGSVNASALLSPATLDLFSKLGPGAVTDNMFGIIERPANPGACGAESSAVGTNTLNCGNARWHSFFQGQTGLEGLNTLSTTAPVNMNTMLSADFCAAGGSDCQNGGGAQIPSAHTGFNVVNNFSWNQTSPTTAAVISSQTMEQVTALKSTGIGTFAAPGSGDQRVRITTSFANPAAPNTASGGNVGVIQINWTQLIEDPDQSGLGSGKFNQNLSGSFIYNNASGASFSVQYPNGQSQTNGNTANQLP